MLYYTSISVYFHVVFHDFRLTKYNYKVDDLQQNNINADDLQDRRIDDTNENNKVDDLQQDNANKYDLQDITIVDENNTNKKKEKKYVETNICYASNTVFSTKLGWGRLTNV